MAPDQYPFSRASGRAAWICSFQAVVVLANGGSDGPEGRCGRPMLHHLGKQSRVAVDVRCCTAQLTLFASEWHQIQLSLIRLGGSCQWPGSEVELLLFQLPAELIYCQRNTSAATLTVQLYSTRLLTRLFLRPSARCHNVSRRSCCHWVNSLSVDAVIFPAVPLKNKYSATRCAVARLWPADRTAFSFTISTLPCFINIHVKYSAVIICMQTIMY